MINYNELLCKKFSKSVVNMIDNVETKKSYGYETFCTIMQKEIWNYEISDIFENEADSEFIEKSNYENFAYHVLKVIENIDDQDEDFKKHKEDCKNAFNIIKKLVEEYNISSKENSSPFSSKSK